MSALSIDFAPRKPRPHISGEHLADVIDLTARRRASSSVSTPYRDSREVANARTTAPLRLTARGRLVVRVTAGVLALAVSIAGGTAVGLSLRPEVAPSQVVVVEQGQSLWGIASAASAPGEDVREVLSQIVALNSLPDSTIVAGQELLVPTR